MDPPMTGREFDHDLLVRFLQEEYKHSHAVAVETVENLRLDGNGLWLASVWAECQEWNRQMIRQATTKEN